MLSLGANGLQIDFHCLIQNLMYFSWSDFGFQIQIFHQEKVDFPIRFDDEMNNHLSDDSKFHYIICIAWSRMRLLLIVK